MSLVIYLSINLFDFTMSKVSEGYNYWIQDGGVPGGEIDSNDIWFTSADSKTYPVFELRHGDLPEPEWMAFGDQSFVESKEYLGIEKVLMRILE